MDGIKLVEFIYKKYIGILMYLAYVKTYLKNKNFDIVPCGSKKKWDECITTNTNKNGELYVYLWYDDCHKSTHIVKIKFDNLIKMSNSRGGNIDNSNTINCR
jgi:hypothetical protein